MQQDQIDRAAELVRAARRIVALSGAGVSTPSGIPDFRGRGGLWTREDPLVVATLEGFHQNPPRFYEWLRPLLEPMLTAQPNPAHQALARLERAGKLQALVTQNIDGLHQRAGSREVYELHGHLRSMTCIGCGRQVPTEPLLGQVRRGRVPRCGCGAAFKPDVVLFDEELPRGIYWLAQRALEQCDLLLIAGTALEVFPASCLPRVALDAGARLIIVNQGPTYLDERADVLLRADVAEALPAIAD